MPLDFFAAAHQKNIDQKTPSFSLSKILHEAIFDAARPPSEFPTLQKINNYYADTTILFADISFFKKEIEKINNEKEKNKDLSYLLELLEKAKINKFNIYIYCD